MNIPGRMYQDLEFTVPEVEGKVLDRIGYLVSVEKPQPCASILYIRVVGGTWQRAFLDAGLAFWEDWGWTGDVPEDAQDDDAWRYVDFSEDYRGATITCARAAVASHCSSRIVVEFEGLADVEIRCVDEQVFDSDAMIIRAVRQT